MSVHIEEAGHVTCLTLDRPQAMNALNYAQESVAAFPEKREPRFNGR